MNTTMSPSKDTTNHNAEGGSRAADAPPPLALAADDGKTDMSGRRPGDEGYEPFNKRSTNAKYAEETAAQQTLEKRRNQWKYHRYALSVLDGRGEHWARR